MTDQAKGQIISHIIYAMKNEAKRKNREFCEGGMFFSLAFMDDKDLMKIAKLTGAA